MAWHKKINGPICVDGDEGTIYLPVKLWEYLASHQFSLICSKPMSCGGVETISVGREHYEWYRTPYGKPTVKVSFQEGG